MVRPRKIPQRMCVGCREMKNKRDLVRIVCNKDGEVSIDPTGKKPGRGAYVCPNAECLKLAVKGKRLEKALGHDIPEEVLETLARDLSTP